MVEVEDQQILSQIPAGAGAEIVGDQRDDDVLAAQSFCRNAP